MGKHLAKTILEKLGPEVVKTIDVVIPIPETSNTSALVVAQTLGIPYCPAFVKNRYIFRTFIMPGQTMRKAAVRRKLNPMVSEFVGRNVLLVDDSIVRGTTSHEIVNMAKDAGAKKVYFSSCAPPIRNAHIYGIDLASTKELVAFGRTEEEVAENIGADAVIYQTLPDLVDSCASLSETISKFEVGVFSGEYVTPVEPGYFEHLEALRGENAKMKKKEAAAKAVAAGVGSPNEIGLVLNGALSNGEKDVKDRMDISLHNLGDYKEA